jgi:hypothetical protein
MEEEFAGLNFHLLRLEDRFVRSTETFYKRPGASICKAGEDRAESGAIYRMPGNERFGRKGIAEARREAAVRRTVE